MRDWAQNQHANMIDEDAIFVLLKDFFLPPKSSAYLKEKFCFFMPCVLM